MKKNILLFATILSVVLLFATCGQNNPDDPGTTTPADTTLNVGDDDNDFVENQSWTSDVAISWNGSNATVTNSVDGITVTNSNGYVVVTSTAKHVTYTLSGNGTGQIKIYSDYKFRLSLADLTLTCSNGPAINNQCHKTCYLVLSGTNTLTDGTSYASSDEDQKATLFSEGQVIVSGSGKLNITGNYKHALASDDYVRIREGQLTLSAKQSDGIHANDGIIINGGTLNITSVEEGLQTDSSSIVITGGTIDITTTGDDGKGILAKAGSINITDGTVNVTTAGSSAKGIKAVGNIDISGGTTTVICTGGSTSSGWRAPEWGPGGGGPGGQQGNQGGPGGGGSSAPEGIESKAKINISGGQVYAQAGDDAINSGSDMTITGGYVCAYSTGNDGLDANGNCYIKGGVVYAIGSSSPELGIDANTEKGYKLYVTGGTIIAIGGLESGSSLTQSCYSSSSWSKSTWYALYNGNDLAIAFKTPASGGTTLVVSTASTPTLNIGVTASNGTSYFNGMANIGATVSGGSNVTLSSYSASSGGGRW